MKICLVSDFLVGFHKNWSGAELVCDILASQFKKEGQEVIFFTTKLEKGRKNQGIFPISTIANVDRWHFFKKIIAPFYLILGFIFSTYHFLREKPDIVHLLHTNYLFIPVMASAKLLRIPVVFTFLDYYLICPRATFRLANGAICDKKEGKDCLKCISSVRFLERRLINFFSQKIDGIITFTETSKKRLIRSGFSKDKIRIIYTYSIPQEFSLKTKTIDKDKNSILFIGTFHKHKGLRVILRALPDVLLRIPAARLRVVGQGNDFDTREINKLIDNLKIGNNIIFSGQKSNEEVLNLILESNLVVVAEQWPSEFGPLALVETMALGRPVVSGNLGSPSDFIKNGESGFLVDFDRPKQYAEKIIWVLENKEAAEKMGRIAKEAGKILFNRNQGKEHIALYQKLI